MTVWRHNAESQSGYLFSLSDSLRVVEAENPHLLHTVSDGTMFIASDYSGQHKNASHEAYSFLIVSENNLISWLPTLEKFRIRWLPDNRRISFKKLNEPVRKRALPAFLSSFAELKANLITILIDRRIGSFMYGGPPTTIEAFPDCFSEKSNHGTVEKMFRLASFVSLILSGLRRENQISRWISDHDEALDTDDKRQKFARLATYLTFGLTGWTKAADHFFATTESTNIPVWSEDIAAIADLAAGAYCQLSTFLPSFLGKKNWQMKVTAEDVEDPRAYVFANWLATNDGALKHVLLRLERDTEGNVRSSAQAFLPNLSNKNP